MLDYPKKFLIDKTTSRKDLGELPLVGTLWDKFLEETFAHCIGFEPRGVKTKSSRFLRVS